jgi:hypothetical protein
VDQHAGECLLDGGRPFPKVKKKIRKIQDIWIAAFEALQGSAVGAASSTVAITYGDLQHKSSSVSLRRRHSHANISLSLLSLIFFYLL